MSKRWFDLIFTIIFVVLFVTTSDRLNDGWDGFVLNTQLLSVYLGYIAIVFVLRRFFYNKGK
jgi:hypothetical protein